MLKEGSNESSLLGFGLCIPVIRKDNIWLANVIEHVDTLHKGVGAAVEHLEEDNTQAVYVNFLDEKDGGRKRQTLCRQRLQTDGSKMKVSMNERIQENDGCVDE